MSAATKYGRPQDLPPAVHAQVQEAGEVLKNRGVIHDAGAHTTPAVKYGTPANNQLHRSIAQERSL